MSDKYPNPSLYTVKATSKEDLERQQHNFTNLAEQLGEADAKEVEPVLSQREVVQPEPELTPDIINRLKIKIKGKK